MEDKEVIDKYVTNSELIIAKDVFTSYGNNIHIINVVRAIKGGAVLVDYKEMQKTFKNLKAFILNWKKSSTPEECLQLVEGLEEAFYSAIGIEDEVTKELLKA